MLDDALAAVAPPADEAQKVRQKMAEQLALVAAKVEALQAEVKSASEEVEKQVLTAQTEVTQRRDEGQAQIDAAMKEVQKAKTQTEVARVDVVSAEAMVDAAVVSNGGQAVVRAAAPVAVTAAAATAAAAAEPSSAAASAAGKAAETSASPAAAAPASISPEDGGTGADNTADKADKAETAQPSPVGQAASGQLAEKAPDTIAEKDKVAASADTDAQNVASGQAPAPADMAAPVGGELASKEKAAKEGLPSSLGKTAAIEQKVAPPDVASDLLTDGKTALPDTPAPPLESKEDPLKKPSVPAGTEAVAPAVPAPDSESLLDALKDGKNSMPIPPANQPVDLEDLAKLVEAPVDPESLEAAAKARSLLDQALKAKAKVPDAGVNLAGLKDAVDGGVKSIVPEDAAGEAGSLLDSLKAAVKADLKP
jgi:hypothetical protein